ncbi:hypothetical protein LGM14_27580, partial [Burkholderia multivorans]|nr:hypothetical protein [Burkholderia multivorans]
STGGHRLAGANPWIGTTICTGNSPKADHELRLKPDHPMGSGHPLLPIWHYVVSNKAQRSFQCSVVRAHDQAAKS